jgi:FAD binding domain
LHQLWATQSSGWLDAWRSAPSAYAVAPESQADVVAAVNFARERNLRLVIKGGGHSFQGTSCAPDSLLISTRRMNQVILRDAFVPQGCAARTAPQPAVEIGAGAIWLHVYEAVTAQAGRFVRGGGCITVGVASLVQSGGTDRAPTRDGEKVANVIPVDHMVQSCTARCDVQNPCAIPSNFISYVDGGAVTLTCSRERGSIPLLTNGEHRPPRLAPVVQPDRFRTTDVRTSILSA